MTDRPNPAAPPTPPLPDDPARPIWSVIIPTHDAGDYLRDTLASVLAQAPPPAAMQVEVVDDASRRDDPARVVDEVGGGRVDLHRQPRNVGAIANFNTCVERARGRFVHILHADDLVRPGFYAALGDALARHPAVGAAFCRCAVIDAHDRETWLSELERADAGVLDDFLRRIAVSSRIQTPTVVVRRTAYETLGGYDPRLFHAGDWEMWQRITAHYPVWYEPRPLACYRKHAASDTARLERTAANVANVRSAIVIAATYLPPHLAGTLRRQALLHSAEKALWRTKELRAAGDPDAALAQLRAAIDCFQDAGFYRRALRLQATALKLWLRRRQG
jgi:glycosyltransferase involved in cell wall biosynthesis